MKHFLLFKRSLAFLLCLSLFVSLIPTNAFAADTSDSASSVSLSEETTFVFDGDSVTVTEGNSTNYEVVIYDSSDTESDADSSEDSNGNTVYSVPDGSTGQLLVSIKKSGGSYVFSGTGNGSIAVKKEATDDAVLYLNGLNLTSAFTSVITVKKDSSAACTIYAVAGTVNTLTDNAYNNDDTYSDNAAAEKAVLKFKDGSDVTIAGSGTININGNEKNGIKANNLLTIQDVTLNISTLDNGISSENSITITSGSISITTQEGDGIKACADSSATGSITITGGTFAIDCCADAIQAMVSLNISGGTFDITTYGGYNAVYDKDDDSYPSAKGLKASGSYEDSDGNEIDATGCTLNISGGTFSINSADDSVHTDGDMTITGGSFTIYSGDDAIHADGTLSAGTQGGSDGSLSIAIYSCYEGLEGADINLYSGTYTIYSTDDCINAANSDLGNYAFQLNISGGNIYAASLANDCLDSNGNITISGGTVIALGALDNSSETNNSLDCDGTLTISGGTVLAIGMYDMMSLPSSGSQTYVTWSAAGSSTAGTDSNGQFTPATGMDQGNMNMTPDGNAAGQNLETAPEQNQTTALEQNQNTAPDQNQGTMPDQGMMQNGTAGTGLVSDDDLITIYDSEGSELISVTASWNAGSSYSGNTVNYVLYSSASLVSGNTYTLALNGETIAETETETEFETETEMATEAETETVTEAETETATEAATEAATETEAVTESGTTTETDSSVYETEASSSEETETAVTVAAPKITSAKNKASGILLTWEGDSNATGYIIFRNGEKIATVKGATTLKYLDTGATSNGQKYVYKVRAYIRFNEKLYKSAKSVKKKIYRMTTTTISSVSKGKSGTLTVAWAANSCADGYVIKYSTSKTFTDAATVRVSASNLQATLSELTSGTKYYIRVRSYKTVNGNTYYSGWSAKSSKKVK
ncbi:MAG: carbohydrate-binding domain-containing protein [Lachnospiraceae bacterium]|nr:carbohydrate-binding domain-containing protein [Lachnospiraceae bacterium]